MSRKPTGRDNSLRAIDLALADALRRRDVADGIPADEHVLLGAALASLAIAHGHAAFDPAQAALLLDDASAAPDARTWCEALARSRWVSTPQRDACADTSAPLVLEGGLLYLRRYREYERRLAQGLQRIAAHPPPAPDLAASAALFAQLFPEASRGDRQARAAILASQQALLLVTGGPGTGKTTTIARVLLLLLAQARHAGHAAPRIALAAPTGRAADRMAQSLRMATAQLRGAGIDAALCSALPDSARTLHRLLGTLPDNPRFRHDRDNPLPFDVVVVDEASMVDLPLMCKLVEAVADGARLLLLGDRDQLPSVEAGDVLAAIVDASVDASVEANPQVGIAPRGAKAASETPARQASLFADTTAPAQHAPHRVHLQRGYRQSDALDLAPLATAVREGDSEHALQLLRGGGLSGVQFHEGLADPLRGDTRGRLLDPWRALADARDPLEALASAAQVRLLTALRDGPQGANALNARIEEALAGSQRERYFHGRLLLVTENSYRHGLFNGDIGVCLRDQGGDMAVWFAGHGQDARGFHPAALPAHAGAFAMTVHKAQGSEFDDVWLLLPRNDVRASSRELLYTALSRARRTVHVCGNEVVVRAALSRHVVRVSGLAARLRPD